jgi:hypothetical protein
VGLVILGDFNLSPAEVLAFSQPAPRPLVDHSVAAGNPSEGGCGEEEGTAALCAPTGSGAERTTLVVVSDSPASVPASFVSALEPEEAEPTNMWRFTADGCQEQGHAYDNGILLTHAAWRLHGHILKEVVEPIDEDMRRLAAALAATALRPSAFGTAIGRDIAASFLPRAGATDGVPPSLRASFRDRVNLEWSDHLPLAVRVSLR